MRALITGGYGFVARHLAHHLISCGDDVAITYRSEEKDVQGIALPKTIQNFSLDITDTKAINDLITLAKPDVIYHLAAQSFVPAAEKAKRATFEVNTFGTLNLLDAIANHSPDTKILFVSSSEVYGNPRPGSLPVTELSELRPNTIYGVTKAAADLAIFSAVQRGQVDGIRVRPFPHFGPGQSDNFAISSFAKQIAEIKLGKKEPVLKVGNLEVKRDWSDVSDIVRGYREAVLNGKPGEVYNLCSGQSVLLQEIVETLIKRSGVDIEIEVDPERVREVDTPDIYGSYERAKRDFGWTPRIDRIAALDSMLAYWLEELG